MTRDGIDSANLKRTLDEVRDGSLSPEKAAEKLLEAEMRSRDDNPLSNSLGESSDPAVFTSLESLQSLLERLGTPPIDIVNGWCKQLESIAGQYQQQTKTPLPSVDPRVWKVDSTGRLMWSPDDQVVFTTPDPSNQETNDPYLQTTRSSELFEVSRQSIREFRAKLVVPLPSFQNQDSSEASASQNQLLKHTNSPDPTNVTVADYESVGRAERKRLVAEKFALAIAERNGEPLEKPMATQSVLKKETSQTGIGFWVYAMAGIFAATALIAIVMKSMKTPGSNSDRVAAVSQSQSDRDSGRGQPVDQSLNAQTTDSVASAGPLEMFGSDELMSESPVQTDLIDPVPGVTIVDPVSAPPPDISTTAPDAADQNLDNAKEATDDGTQSDGRSEANGPLIGSFESVTEVMPTGPLLQIRQRPGAPKAADPFRKIDNESPEEQPQATQTKTVESIRLPLIDKSDEVVSIKQTSKLSDLTLTFPFDVPLELKHDGDTGVIVESREQKTIAKLVSNNNALNFQWVPEARTVSVASMLAHGRLNSANGSRTYLRPTVIGQPLALTFDRPDIRPTWDLVAALPTRTARLDLTVNTSDEIEHAWVYPLDGQSPRRTFGFLMLQPKDGESVQMGLKIDVRCTRKLSCRIRVGGRLDSSMPWDLISRPILQQYQDQITNGLKLLNQQSIQMNSMYEAATTDERRFLRPRRDRIKDTQRRIEALAQRLQSLRALLERTQREVNLAFKLWVQWPDDDSQQLLLETPLPETNVENKAIAQ